VLHAALTGQPPYVRDTVPATMLAHVEDPPPRPSQRGAPRGFDRVLARALAKAPDDRYPSAGDLSRAAWAAARGEPISEAERSVAIGGRGADRGHPRAGAPAGAGRRATHRADRAQGTPTGATRLERPARPDDVRVRSRRRARIRTGLLATTVLAAGLASAAVAGLLGDGATRASSADPVGEGDVRRVVLRFAEAYAREDARAMARTLARDAERVAPGDVQRGAMPSSASTAGSSRPTR
jgi:serine/threonine-protein kinase